MRTRRVYALLGLILAILAAQKLAALGSTQDPGAPASGLLAPFAAAPFRIGFATLEIVVAVALWGTHGFRAARIAAIGLAIAVLLHGVDVVQRGAQAEGCACFSSAHSSLAGVDLARASMLFALFAFVAWSPTGRIRTRSTLVIALLLAGFVGTWFLPPPNAESDRAQPLRSLQTSPDSAPLPAQLALLTSDSSRPVSPVSQEGGSVSAQAASDAVRVRVVGEDGPIAGANVVAWRLARDVANTKIEKSKATDIDGRCYLEFNPGTEFPLALVVNVPPPYVPRCVVLDERSTDELVVQVKAGQALVIETQGLDGSILPNVDLIVLPVGMPVRGESGVRWSPGDGWMFEDSRRATTDSSGRALVRGLDADRVYRAYAPGMASPMTGDPVMAAPAPGRSLVVRLAQSRFVRAIATDADSGKPLRTATWRRVRSTGREPLSQANLFPAQLMGTSRSVLGIPASLEPGEYWRVFVSRDPNQETFEFGPVLVEAPGYRSETLILKAGLASGLVAGPTRVELYPDGEAGTVPVTLRPSTHAGHVMARILVRRARKIIFQQYWDSAADSDLELQLPVGVYEIEVGGNPLIRLDLQDESPVRRSLELDILPSLRLNVVAHGTPYTGHATVALSGRTSTATSWFAGCLEVPFVSGRSPRFIVPTGHVNVGVSGGVATTTGRAQIEPGKHVEASLTVP